MTPSSMTRTHAPRDHQPPPPALSPCPRAHRPPPADAHTAFSQAGRPGWFFKAKVILGQPTNREAEF